MLLQVATWSLVFFASLALGFSALLVVRSLGRHRRAFMLDVCGVVWLGFALIIAFLELASLCGRIGTVCVVMLLAACVPGCVPATRWWLRSVKRWHWLRTAFVAAALAVISLTIARAASEQLLWGDTRSTHIQQVMWARDYGAVVGLGNLNAKLAFDQSAHLFAALLDRGPIYGNSVRVAVPFFVWLTFVQWIVVLACPPRSEGDVRGQIFCALTLPFLIGKVLNTELASLSGDLAMGCVALVTTLAVLRLPFVRWQALRVMLARHAYEAWLIGVLTALLLTVKLSGGMFVFLGGAIFVASARAVGRRWLMVTSALPVALGVGMIARRVVLSGWLLFPMPLGNLHLSWSVPSAIAIKEYRYIRSFARIPVPNTDEVLDHGFLHWFVPWFDHFKSGVAMRVLAAAMLLLVVRFLPAQRRCLALTPLELGTFATLLLSIAYWFLGAPDIRFGAVFFWMLMAASAASIFAPRRAQRWAQVALLALTLLALYVGHASWQWPRMRAQWTHVADVRAQAVTEEVELPNPEGASLTVRVPSFGWLLCGDTPLPCTPYPATQRLRRPGELSSGFLP